MSKRRVPPDVAAAHAALIELNCTTTDSIRELQIDWELEPTGILDNDTVLLVMDMLVARIGERQKHEHPARAVRGRVT